MRRPLTALTALTLAVGLVACSPTDPEEGPGPEDGPGTPSPEVDDADSGALEPTWQTELDVIGQPSVIGGVAVVLTRARDRELDMVGVDVTTGEQLWAHAWSPGSVVAGFSLLPRTTEDAEGTPLALMFLPAENLATEDTSDIPRPIVAVDVRTGEEHHRTVPTKTSTPIGACEDGQDLCITPGGGPTMRIDLVSGSAAIDGDGAPRGARGIGGGGLFSTNDRPGEHLGVQRDGEIQWTRRIEEAVDGALSTDTGWSFTHVEAAGVHVGYLWLVTPEQQARLDAGEPWTDPRSRLVGLRDEDGETLWTLDGARHDCLALDADEAPLMVRCVLSDRDADGDGETDADPTATVEGFDPTTGEVAWSVEATPAQVQRFLDEVPGPLTAGPTILVDTAPEGLVVIDVETGTSTPVDDGETFACWSEYVRVEYAVPWVYQDRSVTDRHGGRLLHPCTPDGAPVEEWTEDAVRATGEPVDGTHVVAVEGALLGFALDG